MNGKSKTFKVLQIGGNLIQNKSKIVIKYTHCKLKMPGNQQSRSSNSYQVDVADLKRVKVWVRDVLFERVKFVYDAEEQLKVGELIFNKCKGNCGEYLQGWKRFRDDQDKKDMYFVRLWEKANNQQNNLIMKGLQARRSTIYAAMSNKFTGTKIFGSFIDCRDWYSTLLWVGLEQNWQKFVYERVSSSQG